MPSASITGRMTGVVIRMIEIDSRIRPSTSISTITAIMKPVWDTLYSSASATASAGMFSLVSM